MESVVIQPAFWQGKRVLITGHTGFKGSWLALWLHNLGAKVFGYALPPPNEPNLFSLANVASRATSVYGDVRNIAGLRTLVKEASPQIIFHLAAQSVVRASYAEPVETYTTNVIGTVNLLEVMRNCNDLRAAVIVTSDKCYENQEWLWGYRENEPMGGRDPYSSSKGCAELVTAAYRASFFSSKINGNYVGIATARAGNVIGGGDWTKDRLIPDIMRAIIASRPVVIRNPHAIRPWQHVLEPLAGYLLLAERLWDFGSDFSEGWNFGPADQDVRPVQWIADRLVDQWGGRIEYSKEVEQPHEANYLKLDSAKARARLGWSPRWDIHTALDYITNWYRGYQANTDMETVVLSQISQYLASPATGKSSAMNT